MLFGTPKAFSDQHLITVSAGKITLENHYKRQYEYVGVVESEQKSQIGFEVSGKVSSLLADEGQILKKGQIIAHVDNKRLLSRELELKAAVSRAEAELALAEITLQRSQKAIKDHAITQQALDEAIQNRDASDAFLSQVKAQLKTVRVDINNTTLIAPYNAIVVEKLVNVGDVLGPGSPVFIIQAQHDHKVRVSITHQNRQLFFVGHTVDGFVNKQPIKLIARAIIPTINLNTRTIDIIFDVVSGNNYILPGDIIKIPFSSRVDEPGFWLPNSALVANFRGMWSYYLLEKKSNVYQVKQRNIEVLFFTNDMVYVRGVANTGELYIDDGITRVVNGQLVNVKLRENLDGTS